MGIKFLCEACGKKLNIKEELGGRKGRCPKCDAKILIPTESQINQAGETTKPVEKVEARAAEIKIQTQPEKKKAASSARSKQETGSKQTPQSRSESGGVAVVDEPQHKPDIKIEIRTDKKNDLPRQDDTSTAPPPPPVPENEPDRISVFDEAGDSKWYVRPNTGGQFGPADSTVMQSWLKEGRVGRDSLVWREGWEEWQSAEEVFTGDWALAEPPETGSTDVSVSPPKEIANTESRIAHHHRSRQRARTMGILLVVGLAIVSIVLAVVLVIVARNNAETEKNKKKEEKTETSCLPLLQRKNHNQVCRASGHTDGEQNRHQSYLSC